MQELENLRKEIDEVDEKIIEFLARRFEIVKKVGEFKKRENITPLQKSRFEEVLTSRKKIAKELGISEDFVEKIWNEIHEYSLNLENKI